MRSFVALVTVALSSVAYADPPSLAYPPAYAPIYERAPRSGSAIAEEAVGGSLIAVGAAGVVTSIALGLSSLLDGLCGIDQTYPDQVCASQYHRSDVEKRAAIGVGLGSLAAVGVGIPLLVVGVKSDRARGWQLRAAPTGDGGFSASLRGTF